MEFFTRMHALHDIYSYILFKPKTFVVKKHNKKNFQQTQIFVIKTFNKNITAFQTPQKSAIHHF